MKSIKSLYFYQGFKVEGATLDLTVQIERKKKKKKSQIPSEEFTVKFRY